MEFENEINREIILFR